MRNKHKTADYLAYQNAIRDEMMDIAWPFGAEQVSFHIEAGVSTRAADIDNVIKPLLDTFQGIFDEFNDNKVYYVEAHKEIVPKGEEYIGVKIQEYRDGLFQTVQQEVQLKTE